MSTHSDPVFYPGLFCDGRSAVSTPVDVRLTSEGLMMRGEGWMRPLAWAYADLAASVPLHPDSADLLVRPTANAAPTLFVAHEGFARAMLARAPHLAAMRTRLRWATVWLTQLVFYGVPWLGWNGRQAVLFDLDVPRFYVFGLVLQPQDLVFLAALLVIAAMTLFFFTAVAGRLWCGYSCPQTVYTELFLWIERRTEGDRNARIRLDAAPFGARKLARKGSKHLLWAAVALYTGFTFVGYFVPIRELAAQTLALALAPWPTFWVLFYGAATYGNAGWLREQVCKYMCPYARLQSTMIDADSLVIAYDNVRGEPRGARARNVDPAALGLGSCVDCRLCVQVCPTGIDIRQGLQNECIGCAACIDVCDQVMDRVGYARGLIRYATANAVARGWSHTQTLRRLLRPRVLAYGSLLVAATVAFVVTLALRAPVANERAEEVGHGVQAEPERPAALRLRRRRRIARVGRSGLLLLQPGLHLTQQHWVVSRDEGFSWAGLRRKVAVQLLDVHVVAARVVRSG